MPGDLDLHLKKKKKTPYIERFLGAMTMPSQRGLGTCHNTDGPRGVTLSEIVRQGKTKPTRSHSRAESKDQTKQTNQTETDPQIPKMMPDGRRVGGSGRGEGIMRYELAVTNWSWGCDCSTGNEVGNVAITVWRRVGTGLIAGHAL